MPRKESSKLTQMTVMDSEDQPINVEVDDGGAKHEDAKENYIGPFKGLKGACSPDLSCVHAIPWQDFAHGFKCIRFQKPNPRKHVFELPCTACAGPAPYISSHSLSHKPKKIISLKHFPCICMRFKCVRTIHIRCQCLFDHLWRFMCMSLSLA